MTFLRKGGGKLASDNHGVTEFAKQRKAKVIAEQKAREENIDMNTVGWSKTIDTSANVQKATAWKIKR